MFTPICRRHQSRDWGSVYSCGRYQRRLIVFISADEQIFIVESFKQTNISCSTVVCLSSLFHYSGWLPLRRGTVTGSGLSTENLHPALNVPFVRLTLVIPKILWILHSVIVLYSDHSSFAFAHDSEPVLLELIETSPMFSVLRCFSTTELILIKLHCKKKWNLNK